MKIRYIIILLLLAAPATLATTYHVDGDSGNNGNDGLSFANAWADPWYADDNVSDGDTIIVYEISGGSGNYTNGCNSVISASTPNTTWQAAAGETVRLSQTGDFSTPPYTACPFQSLVGLNEDSIVFDGFFVWGNIVVGTQGDNAIIENCDLSGGGDYEGFPAVIRIAGRPQTPGYGSCSIAATDCVNDTDCPGGETCDGDSSEWTDNVLVRQNRIHNNVAAQSQGVTNDTAYMVYGAAHMIVEYNEFYDVLHSGIKLKDRSYKNTVRFNYFRDSAVGAQGDGQIPQSWLHFHNNVFNNIAQYGIATESATVVEFKVYNNTFYNTGGAKGAIGWWHAFMSVPIDFYNNIVYFDSGGDYMHWESSGSWTLAGDFNYVNYNDYYTDSGTSDFRVNNSNAANTLSGWQTFLDGEGAGTDDGEDNSVNTDPSFSDASGTFLEVNDFKRTSYPTNGRSGDVMGAFLSDSTVVGPTEPAEEVGGEGTLEGGTLTGGSIGP